MIRHPLLDRAARHGVRLGLERMGVFLAMLGDPHRCAPVVHVAGTNGKGSVCAMVTRILVEAGYRVGTTISPHLQHVNERVQIDGTPVADAVFDRLVNEVDTVRDQWAADSGLEGSVLTYYEMAIASAFLGFAQAAVDVQVVEVGLGGRLDATNLVHPVVCAVTHIGLDHTDILGETIQEIASEKAGILKRGVPVVTGPLVPEAAGVVEEVADRLACPRWAPPVLRQERHGDGRLTLTTPDGSVGPLRLGLDGLHQGANAMVVVGVVHQLRRAGFDLPDSAVVRGLETAFVPGRLEQRGRVLLDGAHNAAGAEALGRALAERPRLAGRTLLFGMGSGRDPVEVVSPLVPHVDRIVTTRCSHPRAMTPDELARALEGVHPGVRVGGDIEQALPDALALGGEVVVAGSLFLVGAARTLLAGEGP